MISQPPVPWFVVPRRGVSTLCTLRDGALVELKPLAMPPLAEYAVNRDGWIVWVGEEPGVLHRHHVDAEPEREFAPLRLPYGTVARCLLFHEHFLYVGGHGETQSLGALDINEADPYWQPFPWPPDHEWVQPGKAIDDLFLIGDRLVAVDNVVEPKWMLLYGMEGPGRPVYQAMPQIPWHTTYEEIHHGAVGGRWMVLWSSGCNHGLVSHHLALFDLTHLVERAVISKGYRPEFVDDQLTEPVLRWTGVALHGDVLLVAAENFGVGLLDLADVATSGPPTPFHYQTLGDSDISRSDRALCASLVQRLRYLALPEGLVARVFSTPQGDAALAVVYTPAGLDTVVLDVPALLARVAAGQGRPAPKEE